MKAIVETIQEEQDVVIRDMGNDLLMVQGVAGSGKTSIALHRAAYLMYQGLQAKLSANNILIVSPNATFEEYISSVLPELGEENAASVVFEDVLDRILKGRSVQSKNEFLEQAVTNNRRKKAVKDGIMFKTSEQFKEILDEFLSEIPLRWIEFHDIYYEGNCVVTKEVMQEWMRKRPDTALGIKLEQLEDYVLEQIFGTVKKRKDAEERNRIRQEIWQFTRLDVCKLYRTLFSPERMPDGTGKVPDEIIRAARESQESGSIAYDDAIAMTYLYLRIYGTGEYRNIRQVVIDEAQDYYPLQYEIFRLLFPNAKFTILGDINQTLAKQEDLSLYEQIRKILNKKNSSLITLDKSFRCTNEILNFSLQFSEHRPDIKSFNRGGDCPKVIAADTHERLLDEILREVEICREKGFETICLLCKTEKNSERLFEELKAGTDIRFIKDRKIESLRGTFIMPVYMSKGLEFDAVILCDVDESNYSDEDDKKLLYVECTRALHRLSVFGEGKISPLITGKDSQKIH